jgi:plastocyanin
MSNADLFYVCGIALAVSAVAMSFAGLRFEKFPGRALPLVILWFAVLVGAATTFAVLHAKDEDKAKATELSAANREVTKEESGAPVGAPNSAKAPAQPTAKGPGGTLNLSASPTLLAFDTKKLTSKPGKVTIDFDNPAAIQHDVGIEKDGKQIAVSPLIASSKTTVSADLGPGTYTFLCTVPGHAQAGMQGTLVVK